MNRRGFLLGAGGILASFAAPAIVRADALMRIVPMDLDVVIEWDLASDGADVGILQIARGKQFAYSMLVRDRLGQLRRHNASISDVGAKSGDMIRLAALPPGESIIELTLTPGAPYIRSGILFEDGILEVKVP